MSEITSRVIFKCPKLSSLPEGMEALTALRELKILDCLDFSRKCREEDSHKIAHVPQIELKEDSGSSSSPSVEEVRVESVLLFFFLVLVKVLFYS